MLSWPLVKYVIKAAVRDRLILALVFVISLGLGLSLFLGSAAAIETNIFSLVFAAASLRFAGILGLVLFVVFHMRRSFDSKDVDYLLSRPIGRVSFVLSHAAGFSLIALVLAFFISIALFILLPGAAEVGFSLWAVSLTTEFLIIVNVALFFSMVIPSASLGAMAVVALYVLARIIGQLLGTASLDAGTGLYNMLHYLMYAISIIIPRLDLMAQTSWLIYPLDGTIGFGFVLMQGVVFIGLTLSATIVDLIRRQF